VTITVSGILILVAVILLFLAALNINSSKVSLGWLGLALWCLSQLIRV